MFGCGLSLCIQGTHRNTKLIADEVRFIPVHTGNTSAENLHLDPVSVYPCAYREHVNKHAAEVTNAGLSLCIQGTRASSYEILTRKWFIPVHTGNTQHNDRRRNSSAVYPCAYREHSHIISKCGRFFGLSLCIQGTRPI